MIPCLHQKFKSMCMTFFVVTETDMQTWTGGGGQLAISEMILVILLNHISLKNQKTFFELLLPNTKPIAGTIYGPPNQTNFMEILNENLSKVNKNNVETYIVGDVNINLWQNGHQVFQKHNLLSCHSVPNDAKNYFDFCPMFGLKQLIESQTRITCSSSSIIDQITN